MAKPQGPRTSPVYAGPRAQNVRKKRSNIPDRSCDQCGEDYSPIRRMQRFCSPDCRVSFHCINQMDDSAERSPDPQTDERVRTRFNERFPQGERSCKLCGKAFSPLRSDAKYCSPSCRVRYSRELRALRIEENNNVPVPKWNEVERKCAICEVGFMPKSPSHKYCSSSCKKFAYSR